jgi:hypothetical protein
MDSIPHGMLGLALGLGVGLVLGLLGGGGSILALPIFLYVFQVPFEPAVAMSLGVVGISAFVGFVTHWRQGTVNLRVALPFGLFAVAAAFVTARFAGLVDDRIRLAIFVVFACTAALLMLRDSFRDTSSSSRQDGPVRGFRPALALQGLGVGFLTALIGAGGGFVIVPGLTLLAGLPVQVAVGSSLLIIAMNAAAGFAGYVGRVPIDWPLVASFTAVAAVGAVAGTRLVPHVPQRRIKQAFAVMILGLGAYFVWWKLWGGPPPASPSTTDCPALCPANHPNSSLASTLAERTSSLGP